ncbi:Uncharacterised protein [Vibrio cholerae]|nr:Uncharacterised protein [Vibrio cholerae]CSB94513.1 Uncharacterised protein [Vibrio cholerae]CSI69459.1 Uncharacterised protein [Vibrio cholerae]
MDRGNSSLDTGRRPDFATTAPRHLLYRRLSPADFRSEKRQPQRSRQRQTGF